MRLSHVLCLITGTEKFGSPLAMPPSVELGVCCSSNMSPSLSVQSAEGVRRTRTALVVDDVEDMLDLLEIALHASGFEVLRASTFSEALDMFDAHSPDIDLLMTDLRVGNESGLELARRLVASKPTLQVLAISGFALDGKVVTARNKIEFLPKPFSTSELRRKLLSIFTPEPAQLTVTVSSDSPGTYKVSTTCSVPKRRGGLGD